MLHSTSSISNLFVVTSYLFRIFIGVKFGLFSLISQPKSAKKKCLWYPQFFRFQPMVSHHVGCPSGTQLSMTMYAIRDNNVLDSQYFRAIWSPKIRTIKEYFNSSYFYCFIILPSNVSFTNKFVCCLLFSTSQTRFVIVY